jgi:tetratricopeptide (TPR) repeat protein
VPVLLAGCASAQDELTRVCAVRQAINPDYRSALVELENHQSSPRFKNEYALFGMSATALSVCGGDYPDAERIGKDTYQAVKKYQDATAETLAAWGKESTKFFKGEPHERSMLAWYLGLAAYQRSEFNDARIFFMQSLLAAATRDEDAAEFREDFRLGHYWLGRAYQHLGQFDNARIAYEKAGRILAHRGQDRELARLKKQREVEYRRELKLEAASYRRATQGKHPVPGAVDLSAARTRQDLPERLPGAAAGSPVLASAADLTAFLNPDFQHEANLIIVVQLGLSPRKQLAGWQKERDEIAPSAYKERFIDVYIDGHRVGPALPLCDMYHQACTRGVQTRRGRQTGKMIAKEVLQRMPFVGGVFAYWNVSADARYVPVLPGEVHVFAARVKPGLHTVALRCSDINQRYLPRYDLERHFIPVGEDQETVLVLQTKENQDNAYLLAQTSGQPAGN